ncbi:Oligoxyloglucan reducing end-specific cellobiohydrolase [Neocallimastix californiae]|uniref:Oligoxyloglucan reducing end-specific cellobiohydrolase n=1 Tax=Neocallimastix californiae TaxID=1754190 RepID=A0A1Y2FCL6_9FUNG|nr:Oligoxyloglucan reducing end-specific cellobiohydrolase [Neocallimastix californiae]|eukprot:ORY81651.1 Oligoxyloglucan reducing end-specific cellobiohydrolase [Neocallimastix californiae]
MKTLALTLIGLILLCIPACFSVEYNWYNTKIGGGGFVTNLIYNPGEEGLLYLRTDMGGSYRYDQTNKSWIPIQDVFGGSEWWLFGCESLGVDTKEPNRVYIAAGTYMSYGENGAIISSDDYGKTWKHRWDAPFHFGANDDGRGRGERLAVNPVDNNIIFFGTRKNGLYKSTNYGESFEPVKGFPADHDIPFILFVPGSKGKTVIVATDDTKAPLYISKDGGSSFDKISGQPNIGYFPQHGAFSADGKYLYVTYANSIGPNGATQGDVYRISLPDFTFKEITPVHGSYETQQFGYTGVQTSGTNAGVVIVSTLNLWWPSDEVYMSTDYGETWSEGVASHAELDISEYPWLDFGKEDNLKFGWWIAALAMDPFNDDNVSYGTGATVYTTTEFTKAMKNESTHWAPNVVGFEETAINDIEAPPSGPGIPKLLTALGDLGGFTQDDINEAVEMWVNPTYTTGNSVEYAVSNPKIVVSCGTDNAAYSTDGGYTWTPMKTLPYEKATGGHITISGDGKVVTWIPNQSQIPYYTTDNGATWTAVDTCKNCNQVRPDGKNPKLMYGFDYQTLYISEDGGKTYIKQGGNMGAGQLMSPYNVEGHLWLACTYWGGVQFSSDMGKTFKEVDPKFKSADSVGFGKAAPGSDAPYTVYIVGKYDDYYGVYRSTDLGSTWELLNDDSHQWGVYNSKVIGDPDIFGRVYIATNGRGVVVGDDTSVVSDGGHSSGSKSSSNNSKKNNNSKSKIPTNTPSSSKCFSEPDFPCCTSTTEVVEVDENGEWGIENGNWCGIRSVSNSSAKGADECFSNGLGYPCCNSCDIIYIDESGNWGVENGDWCGIKDTCDPSSATVRCPGENLGYNCCSSCIEPYEEDENGKWAVVDESWCSLPYYC